MTSVLIINYHIGPMSSFDHSKGQIRSKRMILLEYIIFFFIQGKACHVWYQMKAYDVCIDNKL